jgi:hypothetical protein
MALDFSWEKSARAYLALYRETVASLRADEPATAPV